MHYSFDCKSDFLGLPKKVSEEENIKQHIWLIITTPLGSITLMPEFGSRVPFTLSERLDMVTKQTIEYHATSAIEKHEDRVNNTKTLTIISNDGKSIKLLVFCEAPSGEIKMDVDLSIYVFQKPPIIDA